MHKKIYKTLFVGLFLTFVVTAAFSAFAMPSGRGEQDAGNDIYEKSISENISTPSIPKKAQVYVRTAMDQLRRQLVKQGFSVKSMRDGEVLLITIPCDKLFKPGDVELKPSAKDRLAKLSTIVKEPDRYKVLVAVHTDDTGDEQYADSLSGARANAIDDCLWKISGEKETTIIPYGIGKDEPLATNISRANRELNRRVEIYVIPDAGLLEMGGYKLK